ncbi:MAG: efflux transporter outer membrane subunit [Chlamydiia bacterium]|nr:efflux transporter outer membrane subunit [Chlamydiia bacterium]
MNALRKLSLISVYLFFILFDGCAALKKRNNEPSLMDKVEIAPSIDSALSTPSFREGDWPAYDWWALFEDMQLSEIMEIAIKNNPNLLAAASRVQGAREEAKKVRSNLLPSFSLSFDDNYEHLSKDSLDRFPPSAVPPVINQIHLALNFEYEIDLFGKNRNKYQAAIGRAKAEAAEMSESLLIITMTLAETYISYMENLQNLELSISLFEARKTLLELTQLRFMNGLEDERKVDAASAALLFAEESVVVYEREVDLNLSQIKILMGLSPDDPYTIKTPTCSFNAPFSLPEDIPLNLVSRRPDLMAQIWKVEAAAHLISAAKGAFFPNINLLAFAGLESLKWNTLFTADSYAASLAPAVNLPLFTGGKLTAELNEKYASYDAAVHDYNALLLKAAKEVSDQIKILEAANQRSFFQSEAIEKGLHSLKLLEMRYFNGLDNYLTVLEKRIEVIHEKIKEVGIENERFFAALQLIKSLGGGYHGR